MEENKYLDELVNSAEKEFNSPSTSGQNKFCYNFSDYVILKDKYDLDNDIKRYILSDLQEQRIIIGKLREKHNINTPEIIYYTTRANTLYQVQERAKGRPLGFMLKDHFIDYLNENNPEELNDILKNTKEGTLDLLGKHYKNKNGISVFSPYPLGEALVKYNNDNLKAVLNCDNKLFTKYLEDYKTLFLTYGIRIDNHCENFFFDEKNGFSFIDLNVSKDNRFEWYLKAIREQENNPKLKCPPLLPLENTADMESFCLKEALIENFSFNPANEETRILQNLIIKKACDCLLDSSFDTFSQPENIKSFLNDRLNSTTLPSNYFANNHEFEQFLSVLENGKSEDDVYFFQKKYSNYQQDINFDKVDTKFLEDYLSSHPNYRNSEFEFSTPIKNSTFSQMLDHVKNKTLKDLESEYNFPGDIDTNYKTKMIEPDFQDNSDFSME